MIEKKAIFSEEASEAIMSGKTCFNNGFRSKDGSFYPDQPIYVPLDNNNSSRVKEIGMEVGKEILVAAGTGIILGAAYKSYHFIKDKGIPYLSNKWKTFRKKHDNSEDENSEPIAEIIDLNMKKSVSL